MPAATLDNTITLALSVSDRHVSTKWLNDMLGFETLYHADEVGWSEVSTNTPGVTIGLAEQTQASPGNAVPVFGVADIAAARTALEAEGVKFDGPTETIDGMVSTATFYDPDNNALMLAQDLTKGG
ncbi:MAG: VOC family protein [Rhodobacteraceae bacterium]|nr:VOC family protein [Paracoccaceae bacterium]